MDSDEFIRKMRYQLNYFENSRHFSKEIRCKICINILKLIIKYSSVVFDVNNERFLEYRNTAKNKLYDFKNEKGFIGEEELHKLSLKILQRYYGECLDENRCIAYKLDNTRCVHFIKKLNVCGIHVRYPTKIVKMLTKYVPVDISKKCVGFL